MFLVPFFSEFSFIVIFNGGILRLAYTINFWDFMLLPEQHLLTRPVFPLSVYITYENIRKLSLDSENVKLIDVGLKFSGKLAKSAKMYPNWK